MIGGVLPLGFELDLLPGVDCSLSGRLTSSSLPCRSSRTDGPVGAGERSIVVLWIRFLASDRPFGPYLA